LVAGVPDFGGNDRVLMFDYEHNVT
jgi:hypothetical protein